MTLRQKQFAVYSTVFLALLLLFFFLHVSTGFTYYSHSHLLAILLGGGTAEENTVVFDFRLVRAVLAVLIGMGLALSGAVFQQLTRNELAGPGLLGVNAGAGLGVMILIFLTPVDQGLPIWSLPIVAVVGALIAAGSIFALAMRKNEAGGTYALVLSGITLTAGIHALQTLLIVLLSPEKFNQVNTWIIGNIAGNTWAHVLILGAVVIVLALILYANRTTLNILTLRDETAIGLGVSLKRSRLGFLILAVILAATCVAIGGSIGFIGLVAPHIARRLIGADCTYVLPLTALIGGWLLVTADWVGRVIIAPDEMLVGIVVALIGAPYFLFILARKRGEVMDHSNKTDIRIEGLRTGYDKTVIIDNLNLTIPRGKVTALIGSNGCGKSTLLKTICRIITPMSGTVYLDGQDIHKENTKVLAKKIAILPQHPTAPEGLTIRELIAYGRAPYKNGVFTRMKREDRDIINWALKVTHLEDLADRPIHRLSGGQRQRAWIAMAIAQDTEILFLDEPTSFLDIAHQLEVLQLVAELNKTYGKTIIMVLHELNQAARFADHIIAMKDGAVRFEGSPETVFMAEMLADVFGITAMIMKDPLTRLPFCIPQNVGGSL